MGCYAIHLGDCAGGMTKEHYISHSVLEIVGKAVQVSGFPWQRPDEPMQISTSALSSRILCRHHNSELSHLDETGATFLHTLKSSFDQAVAQKEFTSEVFSIEGEKLELWLLKILCGIFSATGAVAVPKTWVNILFEREAFPNASGISIFGTSGSASWFFNLIRVISVRDKEGDIAGAKFGVGGLALLLAFGKPLFTEKGMQALYRPKSIVMEKGGNAKRFDFSWPSNEGGGSLHLRLTGRIRAGTSRIRPIVEPDNTNQE